MSLGLKTSSVSSTASAFLWSRWAVSKFPRYLHQKPTIRSLHPVINPGIISFIAKLSIVDMLGRAAKEYHPQPPKPDLRNTLILSSSPPQDGNIEKQLRKAGKTTKSTHEIRSLMGNPKSSCTMSSVVSQSCQNRSTPLNELSNVRSINSFKGLDSISSSKDICQGSIKSKNIQKEGSVTSNFSNYIYEYNEDDFEDDDKLNLDADEVDSHNEDSEPVKSLPNSEPSLPVNGKLDHPPISQDQPSSAATWSSSSPSHKLTPPYAHERRKRDIDEVNTPEIFSLSTQSTKRRTLPWLQAHAKNDLNNSNRHIDEQKRELTTSPKTSHVNNESNRINLNSLPNENLQKTMPWNNTGSIISEKKKKLREKKKDDELIKNVEIFENSISKPSVTPLSLSEEQNRILDLVVNKSKSVFFTGSAGTGKSVLMRAIISEFRKRYARDSDRLAVTASTGLAACNIGGVTLHSFGGIGLGKDDVPSLVRKIKRNPKAKSRWIKTKVLIIDEISMVDGELFDKLEGIARSLRNNGRPFGGIQLVITGDFFQLPPVPEYNNSCRGIKFAFDAGTWSTSIHHTIGLTQVFRQKDSEFANMLNEMRLGKITEKTNEAFKSLSRQISSDGYEATELFPTRHEVDNANASRMRNLQGKVYQFEARDSGSVQDLQYREKLLSNMMAPKLLELKKGAQVMLIKNLDDSLVNGSIGIVKNFMSEQNFKMLGERDCLEEHDYESDEANNNNPTVRKPELSSNFSNKESLTANPPEGFPLVSFKLVDGTRRLMLILNEDWKIELPNGEVQAQRTQLPLILAWALSIHKAQGQTLHRVKIDLKKTFEKGQAYVALSRATSPSGLQVLNFDRRKVEAHPKVAQFYNSLYSVNQAT